MRYSREQTSGVWQHLLQVCKLLFLVFLILSSFFVVKRFKLSNHFPIRTVQIYGIQHVSQEDLEELLTPLVRRSFFAVNVAYLRNRILQMPWVAETYVRRAWPDRIEVRVVEKKAAAKWNDQNLLSKAGELFSPAEESYPQGLPQFTGPDGKHIIMLQYYDQMNRILDPLHAKISHLELTQYLTWKLTLDNGISLRVGHKDILTRLNHFVKVYTKIIGDRTADVDYVDLRYSNGVAVRWKSDIKTS